MFASARARSSRIEGTAQRSNLPQSTPPRTFPQTARNAICTCMPLHLAVGFVCPRTINTQTLPICIELRFVSFVPPLHTRAPPHYRGCTLPTASPRGVSAPALLFRHAVAIPSSAPLLCIPLCSTSVAITAAPASQPPGGLTSALRRNSPPSSRRQRGRSALLGLTVPS